MASTSQSKSLHKILATKLTVSIPVPSQPHPTGATTPSFLPTDEFDFSDVFGPSHPKISPSPSSPSPLLRDPPVIHTRSHSFVGPSPRFTTTTTPSSSFQPHNYLFLQSHKEIASQISEDDEIDDENSDGFLGDAKEGTETEEKREKSKVGPDDFEILRVIGKGAFGKVFQVRKKDSSEDGVLAMKVMRKDNIIKKNHVEYMKAERDILTKVVHPFIIQLRYSFQTKSKLYLIFDFINGGHLFYHLYRQGIFSEDQARLYSAEIVSAVSHLHKNGIVHRDLKPENILMEADGHVVLTDFGLAKEIDELSRSNSFCGTMEYMAPEILLSKGHNKEADWWSVGILLYEMLSGQVPYTHANRKKLQQRIISEKLKLPPSLTTEAHSLLKGLLHKDPSKRLGSGPRGADEIKSHSWFRSINWKKLELKEIQPKFKPDVGGKDCTANFDQCWTTMPPNDSPAPTPTGAECFQGYTYVAANPWLPSSG